MRAHETRYLKPAHGWLVTCVMASLFVLMGASGDDVYARHVGMSASAYETAGDATRADSLTVSPERRSATGAVVSLRPDHSSDERGRAAHTLHLLGACLAILCAAAALLHGRRWWPGSTDMTAGPSPTQAFPASWWARVRRGPPPLDPPHSSPVIRA